MLYIISVTGLWVLFIGIFILYKKLQEYDFVSKEIENTSRKEELGKIGEEEVANVLGTLPNTDYIVINNLLYLYKNSTHQIDHVVVSNYGIFIIETKNYSGRIYGSDKYNTWIQYLGKNKYKMLNPVLQNYGHLKALESIIPEYKEYFIPIVCFTNKSTLNIKSKNIVINLSNLLDTIKNYNNEVLIEDINIVAKNLTNISLDRMNGINQDHLNNLQKFK